MSGEEKSEVVGIFHEIVIDCRAPRALAEFWRSILGGVVDEKGATPNWVALAAVPVLWKLAFQRVPEKKITKNRVHLDIDVIDLAAATARTVTLGATTKGTVVYEPPGMFQVLYDPEGNEFCLVTGYPREH